MLELGGSTGLPQYPIPETISGEVNAGSRRKAGSGIPDHGADPGRLFHV